MNKKSSATVTAITFDQILFLTATVITQMKKFVLTITIITIFKKMLFMTITAMTKSSGLLSITTTIITTFNKLCL